MRSPRKRNVKPNENMVKIRPDEVIIQREELKRMADDADFLREAIYDRDRALLNKREHPSNAEYRAVLLRDRCKLYAMA